MSNPRRGTVGKYLLLIVFLGLLAGYFVWIKWNGVAGRVAPFPGSTADLIAFVRQDAGNQSLFLVKSDGSDLRQLTDNYAGVRSPAWSPDGKQIAFAAEPAKPGSEGRAFQLFIKGASDDARQITRGSLSKDSPAWRADGKELAFLTGGVIKIIDPTGDSLKQVYPPPHKSTSTEEAGAQGEGADPNDLKKPPIDSFRWAPNGVGIVARQITEGAGPATGQSRWWDKQSLPASGQETVVVMEAESIVLLPHIDADRPVFLRGSNANQVGISWFPDSNRIVASLSGQQGNHNLAVYRADDPTNVPLGLLIASGYTISAQNPAVSPDSKYIAFEVWKMESAENRSLLGITVLPSESPTVEIKTAADAARIPIKLKGEFHNPQWSPDGTRILYWANGKNGRDIWVANADGSNPINITKGVGDNFDAAWSPEKK